MKYNQVNWLEYPGSPDEQTFNDWVAARKENKHPKLTQTAMRQYSKQIALLVKDSVCTCQQAFEYAAEGGWRAIRYKYVVTAIAMEMDNSTAHRPAEACRSTRDLTLHDEINNTSWADGI